MARAKADTGTAFGIDFGTTNTRVAYFDGQRVRMVPFDRPEMVQLPTRIAYKNSEPVAFGAATRSAGTLFPQSLKWILDSAEPVEVDGGKCERVEVVASFLRHLRQLVNKNLKNASLDRAAVTIPVHYPPDARGRLVKAFEAAGITVTHFFFEPIAAIYAGLLTEPSEGVSAVFDWGGGSLDIATVQIRNNIALTRQIAGWHRGGSHFDRELAVLALNDLFAAHPQLATSGYTTTQVLDQMQVGRTLITYAEQTKIDLSRRDRAQLDYYAMFGDINLARGVTRGEFDELIQPDLTGALARLDLALSASGVTPRTLARMFLSGGTCNVPLIRAELTARYGHKSVDTLRLPADLRGNPATGLDDIGNATAIGAALLAVHGAEPVFADAIGVRLAGGDRERFYPVYRAGERVPFTPVTHRFYVSNASEGVARLLVADQHDPVLEPAGRLLRLITVPIQKDETWLDVRFTVDKHLALRVDAAGLRDLPRTSAQPAPSWPHTANWIQNLNLGFSLPAPSVTKGSAPIPNVLF